ncbi:MAG TPA: M20/M25/M40 family metallo-hydrolase [Acidimicrobiales bacterium]|nr:M20/M25/M40 family metallo-hydrolase [Acidimicrobiales bacterium]
MATTSAFLHDVWERDVVPTLTDYVRIPNKSPAFDPGWRDAGHMEQAVTLVEEWCRARTVPGMTVERHELEGRTPVLLIEVPATTARGAGKDSRASDETVLLYGHLDKQPEMAGWREGLSPWEPVREGDRIFGRGVADDGYATFSALTAIEALQEAGRPHARCVVVIEASEESGSPDLPAHMDALADRIGAPSLVVGLDSGCATYDRLWVTSSLRGLVGGCLRVDVLEEGVHSGAAGGIVPSSFRILRRLLERIEDATTGQILLPALHTDIPDHVHAAAVALVDELGPDAAGEFPMVDGMRSATSDPVERVLAGTWRPQLAVIGADGLPSVANGGNVLRPFTALSLSFRLPPTVDPAAAAAAIDEALSGESPYGARVSWRAHEGASGWAAPATAPWLATALDQGSTAAFGKPARFMGEGGTIPFMAMLGEQFPDAQFVITGVLGPESNAHGPNEFLDLPTAERVTASVAHVLAAHAEQGS